MSTCGRIARAHHLTVVVDANSLAPSATEPPEIDHAPSRGPQESVRCRGRLAHANDLPVVVHIDRETVGASERAEINESAHGGPQECVPGASRPDRAVADYLPDVVHCAGKAENPVEGAELDGLQLGDSVGCRE